MPTKNVLQQQLDIIQRSQTIANDFEGGKSAAESRLKREKETAESTWQRSKGATETAWRNEKSTIELNLQRTKAPVDTAIRSVRESINSTHYALNRTRWQDTLPAQTSRREFPDTSAFPSGSSFDKLMATYQLASEQTSRQVKTLVENYKPRRRSLLAGICGFIIAAALYFILTSILGGFLNDTTRHTVFILTCLLTFVSTSILIYVFFYTQHTQSMLSKLQASYGNLLQTVSLAEDLYTQQLPGLEKPFKQQIVEGETRYKASIAQLDQTYQRLLTESQTRFNKSKQQLEQTLQQQVKALRLDVETYTREAGLSGAAFSEAMWKKWQPGVPTFSSTRLGTVTLKSPLGNLPPLPLFVSCPGGENILFKATGAARNTAIEAIQAFMFRLIATQSPGMVHFTLVDPVALGQNVAGFMQLADYDEALVTGRAWIQPAQIDQQLVDLTEHMGNIIRKYLRGQYRTLEEYKRAGGVAVPYRVLVVMDFPANFTPDSARRLVNIATNGPGCGVSTIVMVDTKLPMPPGFKLADLEQVSTVIAWDGQRFVWNNKDQTAFTH